MEWERKDERMKNRGIQKGNEREKLSILQKAPPARAVTWLPLELGVVMPAYGVRFPLASRSATSLLLGAGRRLQ